MDNTKIVSGIPVTIPMAMSGEQIFDAIMGKIEPELMTSQVKTLKEKYAHESAADKKARNARYKKAYAEYDKQYAVFQSALLEQSRHSHRHAMHSVEEKERGMEEAKLKDLESNFLSTSDQ